MIRPRLSIARSLALVGGFALGFAALRSPSRLWGAAWSSLVLASLTLAVAGILYRRGSTRAFWVGFVISGWLYFWFSLDLSRDAFAQSPLVTFAAADLYPSSWLPSDGFVPPDFKPSPRLDSPRSYWTEFKQAEYVQNRYGPGIILAPTSMLARTIHAQFNLLVSLAGGVFFRWAHDTQRRPPENETPTS